MSALREKEKWGAVQRSVPGYVYVKQGEIGHGAAFAANIRRITRERYVSLPLQFRAERQMGIVSPGFPPSADTIGAVVGGAVVGGAVLGGAVVGAPGDNLHANNERSSH